MRDLEDNLLDWEEDVSYVKSFFETQKEIFDKGLNAAYKYEENKVYLSSKEAEDYATTLQEILTIVQPYRRVKEIPELVNKIEEQIQMVLEMKKVVAKNALQLDHDHLSLRSNQEGVFEDTKNHIQLYYDNLYKNIDGFGDIFKVDATISQSSAFKEKQDLLLEREINDWHSRKKEEVVKGGSEQYIPRKDVPQKEQVKMSKLFVVKTLSSEQDVDKLVNTVSAKLKQIIKNNKSIEFIE